VGNLGHFGTLEQMDYSVVIVNWNGGADTIACLASLFGGCRPAHAIVIDNGSTDDSVARILSAMQGQGVACWHGVAGAAPAAPDRAASLLLLEAGANLGFAVGCNLGLQLARTLGSAAVVFLNNDTLVEADAIDALVAHLAADPDCHASLPMITVHGTDRIWNCGGWVSRLGLRRYFLAGQPRAAVAGRPLIPCSFFTGCCLALRTEAFAARGGFSERFFFGEEDFELALWMQARGLAAHCLTEAVVQHKVSASFNAAAGSRGHMKTFVYFLNRFIHMRLRLGTALWRLWLAAYLPYVLLLLWRSGGWGEVGYWRFVRRLLARAARMDGVSRSDFEAIMAGRI
jgi:GT2 family glycosyltransferase